MHHEASFMRRPKHDGQNPRPLQLKATSRLRLVPRAARQLDASCKLIPEQRHGRPNV
jgi:hypothetical protein